MRVFFPLAFFAFLFVSAHVDELELSVSNDVGRAQLADLRRAQAHENMQDVSPIEAVLHEAFSGLPDMRRRGASGEQGKPEESHQLVVAERVALLRFGELLAFRVEDEGGRRPIGFRFGPSEERRSSSRK